jgi:hypothetical protein
MQSPNALTRVSGAEDRVDSRVMLDKNGYSSYGRFVEGTETSVSIATCSAPVSDVPLRTDVPSGPTRSSARGMAVRHW